MKYFITGITGSLGLKLSQMLLNDGHQVIGYSRCELKQSQIPKHTRLTLYLGDVRDRDRLLEASRGVDVVFHLAALKRIEAADEQPEECIATNVTGTENVLFAQRMNAIPRVVLVSTDKACLPITTYGASKFLAESLVMRNQDNIVVRYGNVLASRGSILHTFKQTLEREGKLYVTDKRCTRFWWTLDQAAEFVYRTSLHHNGGLNIPRLRAYPVVSLGFALAEVLGIQVKAVDEIGFRCREKLHEDMRTPEEGGRLNSGDQDCWFSKGEMKTLIKEAMA